MVRHLAFACLALASLCGNAHAQLFRAYLSTGGSDANPCTLAAPCRLLPAALNAVADGGEVWMLDSGNFNTGMVTFSKSVSVLGVPGVQASLVANGTTAVQVTLGLNVALRNLVFVPVVTAPQGVSEHGLSITVDSRVLVDRCVFAGLRDDAIWMTFGQLTVVDSVIRDSKGVGRALMVQPFGPVTVDISGTRIVNNAGGAMRVNTNVSSARVTVTDTILSGTGGVTNSGVEAIAASAGDVQIHVTRSKLSAFGTALSASTPGTGNAALTVSASMVTGNNLGLFRNGTGGTLTTLGDNHIEGNTTFSVGTITTGTLR